MNSRGGGEGSAERGGGEGHLGIERGGLCLKEPNQSLHHVRHLHIRYTISLSWNRFWKSIQSLSLGDLTSRSGLGEEARAIALQPLSEI